MVDSSLREEHVLRHHTRQVLIPEHTFRRRMTRQVFQGSPSGQNMGNDIESPDSRKSLEGSHIEPLFLSNRASGH